MRRTICFAMAMLSGVSSAGAQEDFSGIRVKLGQRLIATERGVILAGRLTQRSATSLTIGSHVIKPMPGLTIERDHGHTVVHDLLVGLGIGAAVGFVVIGRGSGRPSAAVLGAFSGGFWGATSADRAIPSRTSYPPFG